jgi:ADP-ribose pyrophosphatase
MASSLPPTEGTPVDIMSQRVIGEDEKWRGRWLRTTEMIYLDARGVERRWETLVRTTHSQAECDAVEVVPILKRSCMSDSLVLIKQFRVPVGKVFVELPAGLTDADEPPSVAAVRELLEETGYHVCR